MKEQHKLTLQMAIFFLIIFVTFGTIIINEKQNIIFLPKIENSINDYITENYDNLNLKQEKIKTKDNKVIMKVENNKNKNLHFYVTYKNKKITDTYKKDYEEGKSLLSHLNKKIENTIRTKTNINCKIEINNTYDKFSNVIKEKLLKEENIESLKIYTLKKEITTEWNNEVIANEIILLSNTLKENNITPKNYSLTITNKSDITKSVTINNINDKIINNTTLPIIINDIINNSNTNILSENKITYKYLN